MGADALCKNDGSDEILEFGPGSSDDALELGPGSSDDDALEFEPSDKGDEKKKGDRLIRRLNALGLDTGEGIKNCNNDISLYRELIGLYAKESTEKVHLLHEYLEKGELKEYRVVIHAIKSTSRTIGAPRLYEMAKKLEDAAKEENRSFIDSYQDVFLEMYTDLAGMIYSVLDMEVQELEA